MPRTEVQRMFRTFNAGAPAFLAQAEALSAAEAVPDPAPAPEVNP
jgi:hypothetical protein